MPNPAFHTRAKNRGRNLSDYWPLLVLVLISFAAAFAINSFARMGAMGFMHFFMGFFLISFAMLKLFHPPAFASGFRMYDLVARHVRPYAYFYPLIELGLGLAYLAFIAPIFVYVLTIIIFVVGAAGVVLALRRGLDINCPCMGSILSVPLSTVTLTEDIAMIIMAAFMLLHI